MDEQWLPVRGYEGKYEVSDHGRVRTVPILHKTRGGGEAILPSRILTQHKRGGKPGDYYRGVSLTQRSHYVHRLVLEAFVGPCPPGQQCRHLNGIPTDNRLENLAWGTPSEDNFDRIRHGTHQHSKKTECKWGHPLDGVVLNPDGTVHQRICLTCRRAHNRDMKRKKREALKACPQGHPFDGIAYNADGTVRQRYCKKCRSESVSRQMRERYRKKND